MLLNISLKRTKINNNITICNYVFLTKEIRLEVRYSRGSVSNGVKRSFG